MFWSLSSWTEDGHDRKLVGDDLRYKHDKYVRGRAASVTLDENDRAVGIRGVRIMIEINKNMEVV